MKHSRWFVTISIFGLVIALSTAIVLFLHVRDQRLMPDDDDNTSDNRPVEVKTPLTLYYIALEDNGISGRAVGCGDSAIAVETGEITTTDVIKSTFERLLSDRLQWYGESGLYNVLYNSNLKFASSRKVSGVTNIYLTGTLSLSGECDNPRVQAVLELTAKKAANVENISIFINARPLAEVLSLK